LPELDSAASTKDKESTSDEQQSAIKLEEIKRSMFERKVKKFQKVLSTKVVDLEQLRSLAWNGIPAHTGQYRA
jgi:hypothetical protein